MKKLLVLLPILTVAAAGLSGCGSNSDTVIRVGASPSPHCEILNSSVVQDYVTSKGYTLKVVEYDDYKTPNKALNDGGIDANYFQHIPFLDDEVATKGYSICAVAKIHYEPLNLYGKSAPISYEGTTINVINDVSNLERALALLQSNGIIDTYTMDEFDTSHPENNYTSSKNVTIKCIEEGLLTKKVDQDDGLAVIPGNFALTSWGAATATSYRIFGESEEVAGKKANVIAARNDNCRSDKINVLCEALSQSGVGDFISATYGPTVVYSYSYLL